MGYYTTYSLSVLSGDDTINHQKQIIEQFPDADFEMETKWYDSDANMKEYSLQYPETVFLLEGEGEENDDVWKKNFKNGKMQECYAIITFDEYDETKLE